MKLNYLLVLSLSLIGNQALKLNEKFAWKQVSFAWPSDVAKNEAIASGHYIPENNLPLGLDIWKDKLFITVPRWKVGVASPLNFIQLPTNDKSPILQPYPNWNSNILPDTSATDGSTIVLKDNSTIISPYRIRVDECDRLWVMDTGLIQILPEIVHLVDPAIVIFDLNTNKLIRRYVLPKSVALPGSSFPYITPDVNKDNCDNAYAYLPDVAAFGVVVYSFKENTSWRILHNYFHLDPLKGNFHVGGVNYRWPDGVFAMELGLQKSDGTKDVYFHALSSTKEFAVSNHILQNITQGIDDAIGDSYYDYKYLGDRGDEGQSSAAAVDKKTGVVFYTLVNKDAIGCWNSHKPYTIENQGIADSDSTALLFPNELKVDDDNELWVMSNRMPVFMYSNLNPEEYNYRILKGNIKKLIVGTPCE